MTGQMLNSLKPPLRAYALGYASATGPRLLGALRALRRRDLTVQEKLHLPFTILETSTQLNRFPTAVAIITGGATTLPRLIRTLLERLLLILGRSREKTTFNDAFALRLKFICSFLSSWLAFSLLNRDQGWVRK